MLPILNILILLLIARFTRADISSLLTHAKLSKLSKCHSCFKCVFPFSGLINNREKRVARKECGCSKTFVTIDLVNGMAFAESTMCSQLPTRCCCVEACDVWTGEWQKSRIITWEMYHKLFSPIVGLIQFYATTPYIIGIWQESRCAKPKKFFTNTRFTLTVFTNHARCACPSRCRVVSYAK